MKIETHNINDTKIAEVISADYVINNASDGLDLLGNISFMKAIKADKLTL